MPTARSLRQHLRNANKGTARGAIQLEESVKKFGFGRSIVVDKNDMIVAGNHLNDVAAERDVKVIVVETHGEALVVVKRTDFDLSDPTDKRAIEYAVADNQTAKAGLEWDGDVLAKEIEDGADFSDFFTEDELAEAISGEKRKPKGEAGTFKIKFTDAGLERFKELLAELKQKLDIDDDGLLLLEVLERELAR